MDFSDLPEGTHGKLNEYIKKAKTNALRTKEINKEKAEECIVNLCKSYGFTPPEKIVFCKSPVDVLKKAKKEFNKEGSKWEEKEEITHFVLGNMDTPWMSFWDFVVNNKDFINEEVIKENKKRTQENEKNKGKEGYEEKKLFNKCADYTKDEKVICALEAGRECHWYLLYDKVGFVSDFPKWFSLDLQDRLHNESQPSFGYSDGNRHYSVRGVEMPKWVFEEPEKLTVEKIASEKNAEVRRVMVDKYGREKLLKDAKLIHKDEWGNLYHIEKIVDIEGNPYAFVDVPNATKEPDGSIKRYLLRVNPVLSTAREAVASLAPIENFNPVVET
jgi:hypothetical protein